MAWLLAAESLCSRWPDLVISAAGCIQLQAGRQPFGTDSKVTSHRVCPPVSQLNFHLVFYRAAKGVWRGKIANLWALFASDGEGSNPRTGTPLPLIVFKTKNTTATTRLKSVTLYLFRNPKPIAQIFFYTITTTHVHPHFNHFQFAQSRHS